MSVKKFGLFSVFSRISRKDVCWENFLFADRYGQLEMLHSSLIGYIQAYYEETGQTLTLQEMEKIIRQSKLRTYLIATNPLVRRKCYDYQVFTTRDKVPRRYYCKFICNTEDLTLQECLKNGYEENFAKLAETGIPSTWITRRLEDKGIDGMLMSGEYLAKLITEEEEEEFTTSEKLNLTPFESENDK